MHKPGWLHTLRWGSPYTTPPNGLPRILGAWADREPTTDDFLAVYPAYRLGCGYFHSITFPETPAHQRRKLSPEVNARRKQRARMTAEANRVRKALPLLADVIIRDSGLDWRQNLQPNAD